MLNRKNVEVRLSAEGNKSDAKENWNPETTTVCSSLHVIRHILFVSLSLTVCVYKCVFL